MKKFLTVMVLFKFLFSYYLVVNTKDDVNKLKEIGIDCKYNTYEMYYVCAQSDDLDQLKRVKRYISLNFNIPMFIVQSDTEGKTAPQPVISEKPDVTEMVNKKVSEPVKKTVNKTVKAENTSDIQTPAVKSGYCIQVASSRSGKAMLKLFKKYADLPYSRVEKIGGYYVLRVGESKKYENIKELKKRLDRGFIRKCDYIPQRIVVPKKKIINPPQPLSSAPLAEKPGSVLAAMYDNLNNGNIIEAEKIANRLTKTKYYKDAYNVLGIIALKKSQYGLSCNYLKRSNNRKLKNTACYLYNLKKGYAVLNENPSRAYSYFKKAEKYKKTDDLTAAFGYAYLNTGHYEKALGIFKRLYRKYPDKPSVVKGYIISLYNLGDYSKLRKLKPYIPEECYNDVSKYYFYVDLDECNKLIKKHKYDLAQKKLLKLYKTHPNNVNVLLALGNLYMKKNNLKESEKFYKKVLELYPDNIYALEGMRAIELKRGNFDRALKYSEKLRQLGIEVEDKNIEDILKIKRLRKYISSLECDKAKETIRELKNYESAEKYMLIGDYYKNCEHNETAAFGYYKEGFGYSPENFGIKLKYLYALMNLNKFNKLNNILSTIDEKKLNPIQKIKLKQFYVDYYAYLAGKAFEEKEYKKALNYCRKSSSYGVSPACYEISGWSCFKLKNYECAKENFEKADKTDPNEKVKYALALCYMNMNEKSEAKRLLDMIANTKNEKLRLDIAKAYIALGELDNGEKTLLSVNDDNLSMEVNKTYNALEVKKSDYLNFLELGVNFRYKSGTQGLDKLNDTLSYIKGGFFINEKNFLYFKLGGIDLYSGELNNYGVVGSGEGNLSDKWLTDYQGFLAKIGYKYDSDFIFGIELGITPQSKDSDVSYTYTGKVSLGFKYNSQKFLLSALREPVRDSILSYVGNNDPYSGVSYGRVLNNEIKFEYENLLDIYDSILYLSAYMSDLSGENVKSNTRYGLEALNLNYIGNDILSYDYLGFFGMYQQYEHNENSFLYGNGGYFSPEYFALLALRYEGFEFLNDRKFGGKIYTNIGLMNFKEDDVTTSLGFELGGYMKYLINGNLAFKGGLALRKSADYSDFYINFALQYYFGRKYGVSKTELNKELKEMLKTW